MGKIEEWFFLVVQNYYAVFMGLSFEINKTATYIPLCSFSTMILQPTHLLQKDHRIPYQVLSSRLANIGSVFSFILATT